MLQTNHHLQNRYRIIRLLGQGGMGTVYQAADTRLGDISVAIKEMNPNQLQPQDRQWAITAFRQEASLLARLRHPGIAAVTDYFNEGGYSYLVMEYVAGQPLSAFLHRAGAIPPDQALAWIQELGQVLSYLHNQNPPIIFRDLKPGNIMIRPDNTLALIDFGIARLFKSGQSHDTVQIGTPGYAPPEQYGRGQTDPRSDVYSLAVVLHQMLTGYDPALTPMNLPPVRQLNAHVPQHIAIAISQALHIDPIYRFPAVTQFLTALRSTNELHPPTQPFEDSQRGGRWPLFASVGVVALFVCGLIVAAGWYFTLGPGRNTSTPIPPFALATATPTPTPGEVVITGAPGNTPTPTSETILTPTPTAPTGEPTRTRAEIEAEYVAGLDVLRPGNTLFADHTNQPPTLDGNLSDWASPRYPIEAIVFGAGNVTDPTDLSAQLQLAWDNNFLYLATQVTDNTFVKNAFQRLLYQSDSLEIWFDSDLTSDFANASMSNDDYQIGISPGNHNDLAPLAYLWQPFAREGIQNTLQIASQRTPTGYDIELAIPWNLYNVTPQDGHAYGFTLCVSDNDQPATASQDSMACAHASRLLSDPTSLGTLVLITPP